MAPINQNNIPIGISTEKRVAHTVTGNKATTINTETLESLIIKINDTSFSGDKKTLKTELCEILNKIPKEQIKSTYNKNTISVNGKEINISSLGIVFNGKTYEITKSEKTESNGITSKYVNDTSTTQYKEPLQIKQKVTFETLQDKYKNMKQAYLTLLSNPTDNTQEEFEKAYTEYYTDKEEFTGNVDNKAELKIINKKENILFSKTTETLVNKKLLTKEQQAKKNYLNELKIKIHYLKRSIQGTSNTSPLKAVRLIRLNSLNNLLQLHSGLLINRNSQLLTSVFAEEGNQYSLLASESLLNNDRSSAYRNLGMAAEKYLKAAELDPKAKINGKLVIEKAQEIKLQQKQIESKIYQELNDQLAKVKELEKGLKSILLKNVPQVVKDALKTEKTNLQNLEQKAKGILGRINKETVRGQKISTGVDGAGNDDRLYKQIIVKYTPSIDGNFIARGKAVYQKLGKQNNFYFQMNLSESAGDISKTAGLARLVVDNGSNYSVDQKFNAYSKLADIAISQKSYANACYILGELNKLITDSKYKDDQVFTDRLKYLELTAREGRALNYKETVPFYTKAILFVKGESTESVSAVYKDFANIKITSEFSAKTIIKMIEYYGRDGDKDKVAQLIGKLGNSRIGKNYLAEAKYTYGLVLMETEYPKSALKQFNIVLKNYPQSNEAKLIKANFSEFNNFNKVTNTFDLEKPINNEEKLSSLAKSALKVSQSYTFTEALAYTSTGAIIGGALGGPKGALVGVALSQVVLVGKQVLTDWDKVVEAYQTGYNNISSMETKMHGIGLAIDLIDVASLGSAKALKTTLLGAKKLIRTGQKQEALETFKQATKELIKFQTKYYAKKPIKTLSVTAPIAINIIAQANSLATTGNIDTEIFKMLLTGKIVGKTTNKINVKLYQKKLQLVDAIKTKTKIDYEIKNPIEKLTMRIDKTKSDHIAYETILDAYPGKEIPVGVIKNNSGDVKIVSPSNILDLSVLPHGKRSAIHALIQDYQNPNSKLSDVDLYNSINTHLKETSELTQKSIVNQIKLLNPANVEVVIGRDSCFYTEKFKNLLSQKIKDNPDYTDYYITHNHINNESLSSFDKEMGHGLIKKKPALGGGWKYELILLRRQDKAYEMMLSSKKEKTLSEESIMNEYGKKLDNSYEQYKKLLDSSSQKNEVVKDFSKKYIKDLSELRNEFLEEIQPYYDVALKSGDPQHMHIYAQKLAVLERSTAKYLDQYFESMIKLNPATSGLERGRDYEIITYGRLGLDDKTMQVSTLTDFDIKIICREQTELEKKASKGPENLIQENIIKNDKLEIIKSLNEKGIEVDYEYLLTNISKIKEDMNSNFHPYFSQYINKTRDVKDSAIATELSFILKKYGYKNKSQKLYDAVFDFFVGKSDKGKSLLLILGKKRTLANADESPYKTHIGLEDVNSNNFVFSPKYTGKRMGDLVSFIEYLQKQGVKIDYPQKDLTRIKKIANFCSNLETYMQKNKLLTPDGLITAKNLKTLFEKKPTYKKLFINEAINCGLLTKTDINNEKVSYDVLLKATKYLSEQYKGLKNIKIQITQANEK